MDIYVVGKWQDRFKVRSIQADLRELGHQITVDWTTSDFGPDGVLGTPQRMQEIALEDLQGVKDADAVVALIQDNNHVYKGVWVEIGIALADNKPVYVIGNAGDTCIFMNHPAVRKITSLKDIEGKELLG